MKILNLPLALLEIVLAQMELSVWSHDSQVRESPQTDLSAIAKRTAYVKGTAVMRMVASPEIPELMMEVAGVGQGIRMLAAKRMDCMRSFR